MPGMVVAPMITRRTKVQLLVFVLITLLGVSFVGARYARLDRLFVDDSYTVVAHFEDSGGIFAGAEVTYRGVRVGQVEKLQLTDDGVDVYLDIDNGYDDDPGGLAGPGRQPLGRGRAVRRAPAAADNEPYLTRRLADRDRPTPGPRSPTQTLLADSRRHRRVGPQAGAADHRRPSSAPPSTAPARTSQRIIDTGNSFIHAANANFDTTTALIRDSNTVLKGQIASASAIRTFARDLALFSGTLAGSDPDLRKVIDNGSATANRAAHVPRGQPGRPRPS